MSTQKVLDVSVGDVFLDY